MINCIQIGATAGYSTRTAVPYAYSSAAPWLIELVVKRTFKTAFAPNSWALCHHALHGLPACFEQQLGIAVQLTAHQVLQTGGDVPPEVLRADRVALHQALHLPDGVPRDRLRIDHQHALPSAMGKLARNRRADRSEL
jgi:hypothetical protein